MSKKEFLKTINKKFENELLKNKFKRFTGDIFLKKIDKDIFEYTGLTKIKFDKGSKYRIAVTVGVRSNLVENKLSEILSIEKDNITPTISMQIGYLTPDNTYNPYIFILNEDIDAEFDRFITEYRNYGKKYINKNLTLDGICNTLENDNNLADRDYRLPIVYYYLKKYNNLKELLLKEMKDREGIDAPETEQYKIFSESLIYLIDHNN